MAEDKGLNLDKDAGGSQAGPQGRNYLLAIAIDQYVHCSKLNNAVKDVQAFIELMQNRYNFEEPNITFIKNGEATKKRIENEFFKLTKNLTTQDNLIVYFSGHGRYDKDFGGNWVPVDAGATDDDWPDYLSNDSIRSHLSRINCFHTFLIADSCFSGSLFIDKTREKFTGDRRETEPSRWGLTSGKREIVSDGKPGQHSPFATALLDVLKKADQPPGVMRLCDLVLEKVAANAQQTPIGSPLNVGGHQGGQFVFHFRADENADWKEMNDSVEGCRRYLALYPDGKYRQPAEGFLAKASEEEAWKAAKAANSLSALLDFERRFPESHRITSGEVNTEIAQVDEEELWQKATRSNTVTAYRSYILRSQLHKYRKEAEKAIAILVPKEDKPDEQKKLEAERSETKQREETAALKKREAAETQRRKDAEIEKQARLQKEQNKPSVYSGASRNNSNQKTENRWGLYAMVGGSVFVFVLMLLWKPLLSENEKSEPLSSSEETIPAPFEEQMVQVRGGTFTMGCKKGRDSDCDDGERPAHTVTLADYKIGKYEVTQAQWRKVMGADPPELHNKDCDQCPVEGVSWDDVEVFLKKLNANTNMHYRLPTEAEWEYAARGGDKSKYYTYAGGNDLGSVAWYEGNYKYGNIYGAQKTTRPIGGKMSNELGLYDMSGNVWEWVADCWHWAYQNAPAGGSSAWQEANNGDCGLRVVRGGAWYVLDWNCRVAYRDGIKASTRINDIIGFRLARD